MTFEPRSFSQYQGFYYQGFCIRLPLLNFSFGSAGGPAKITFRKKLKVRWILTRRDLPGD
jgi:hypothetical protein